MIQYIVKIYSVKIEDFSLMQWIGVFSAHMSHP